METELRMREDLIPRHHENRRITQTIGGLPCDITVDLHWDTGYLNYVLQLPDIDLEMARKLGLPIHDEVIIFHDLEDAKQAFNRACHLAEMGDNVYQIYSEIEETQRQKFQEDLAPKSNSENTDNQ